METSNMAYSLETSSVKTIVPGAEVSGFCDVVARQKINEVSGEVPQLSAGEGIDISTADGKTVITNNISAGTNISLVYDMETNTYRIDAQGGSELPSAISAWSFNNYSQSYSHTPGDLFTETYTGSLFAPSSQWGGGPDSKPRLLLDTTVENYSGTSWVYEHGITSTGHRTTRLDDNQLYINYVVETAEDIPIEQQYTMVEPDFIRLWGSNNTGRLIELGSSGVARSTTESATWSQIISAANATGSDTFPIVSSDNSTPQYKFIYELDGNASGIEVSYTNSGQYVPDWVSSTLVSPTEIKSVISSDGGYTATGFSLTPNGVSASGGWPLPRYRSWLDLTKPTIQWSDAAPDVASVYGSGALLNLKRNGLIAVLSNSGLQLGAETGTYDKFSGVYINGKGVSSKNAFGLYTYNQYATWEQILNAATGSQGHTYTGVAPIQVNNTTDEISITGESLSAGPGIDMFSSGGYVVISANGGGGEGAIYTGISPIDVNNTTHQISAKGVSFGVQSPLFFVQDDNEAVIIGCSASGGTAELISTGYRQVLPSDVSYSMSSQLVDGIVRDTLIVSNPMGGMAQGGTTTSVTNYNAGGLDFSSHFVGNDSTEIDDSFTLGWKNCKNIMDSVETSASAWNDTTEVVQTNSATWAQTGGGDYVPLSSTACSIGSNNTTTSYSLAQGLNNVAKYGSFAQAYNSSADNYSLAQGNNNSASYYSLAQGTNNRASSTAMAQGDSCSAYSKSMAIGYRASAGYNSLCLGEYASAYTYSFSIGGYNKIESTSFALGYSNTAKWGSVALGYGNHSAIATSFCFGYANTGNNLAAVFGKNLILNGNYNSGTMALGTNNKLSADVAFVIGNGSSYSNRSDCFVIYPDGSVSAAGKISADGVELGAGGGSTYTGDAQGALDEVYANSGVWLTAHQSLADYQTTAAMTGYQTKLSSVNNIVYTASLPATPDANTLYLIPEA